jgi:hypothetical protein
LGHPLERSFIYGDNVEVPSYLKDEIVDQPIYGLDEIVAHPLFRVYYTLPLFRQYWQYPMFQRYVASIYFQRFWQVPAFQQYFVSPVLFYKYVYPLVTLFQYGQSTSTYPTTYKTNYPSTYNYNHVEDWSRKEHVAPFASNYYNRDHTYAQSLLENIYGHLNVNTVGRHGRLHEVLTEVEVTPEGQIREETYGKIVDPVTGEVRLSTGDAKIVSEKVIPFHTTYPEQDTTFTHHRDQYDWTTTYNRFNPLAARFFHGYNYGRVPVVDRF